MLGSARRFVFAAVLSILGASFVGCDGGAPPPVNNSEPEKLSGGMEQMKKDMMNKMQKGQLGKNAIPKGK